MKIVHQKEILAFLIIVVAVVTLYSTFSEAKCADLSCFEAHMVKCKPASFINDAEEEAAWKYEILGISNKKCDIEVTLLIAKESNLDLRLYEKDKMICSHPIGSVNYPEKDLSLCSGKLKEGLQSIVIEKLYKYIVVNIGEVREEISTY